MVLNRIGTFLLDILEVVVFAVGIFFFVYLLILRPHKIKGTSMHPNYPDGQYLLTEKVTYYLNDPKRGDVVVFKPPVSDDEFIKRVIALPGEKVALKEGKVYVNDKLLKEPYLADDLYTYGSTYLDDGDEAVVPEGSYFVLGDNRPHSSDSRAWGPVKKEVLTGRAWVVYWPASDAGLVRDIAY